MKTLLVFIHFAKAGWRSMISHREAYLAGIIGQWLAYGTSFLTLYILISNFNILGGWSTEQVLIMYAINLLSYSIGATFFYYPCIRLQNKIKSGEFDLALTKPMNPLLYEMCLGFNGGYVSHITLSLMILIYYLRKISFQYSFLSVMNLLIMVLGASLIHASFYIGTSAACFFMINENPILELRFSIKRFTDYPISIYHASIQILLTCIVPFAFMNFYPTAAILSIDNHSIFPNELAYFTPVVGGLTCILCIKLWNKGVTFYKSTGS